MSIAATSVESRRLRDDEVPAAERHYAIAIHLTPFALLLGLGPFALGVPLILWLLRKDESPFVDDHGRETINFLISYLIFTIATAITVVIPLILLVAAAVNLIRGSIAASNGEYFRYPMTIRFLS